MSVLNKFYKSLKERGPIGTIREITRRLNITIRMLGDRRFDRRFGVDTSGIIDIKDLDIDRDSIEKRFHYEPTPEPALRFLLRALPIDHSKYVFIDFGSGKGRVLLLASEYPYKQIIGVEFSQRLHSIAETNFKTWKNPTQKCFNLESVCMDACDFNLPNEPLILFFFTPFKTSVITKVINNIQESLRENTQSLKILYYGSNPEFVDVLNKLDLSSKEIYAHRPFSAIKKYKGLLFN